MEEFVTAHLAEELGRVFGFDVAVLGSVKPPVETFDLRRRQHMSTGLLKFLLTRSAPEDSKILGVTYCDICNPIFAFVFGEAQQSGRAALISLLRFTPEFYGAPPNRELFLARATTEAVHETAHTLGLLHCGEVECVMALSNSVAQIDRKEARFCASCRDELEKRVAE